MATLATLIILYIYDIRFGCDTCHASYAAMLAGYGY